MTYDSPAWEFAADTQLMKLQRLQNKALRTIGNFPRRTPARDLHMAFKIPYGYDYITKLCSQQAEVVQNHDNENVRNIGQGEAGIESIRGLNLAVVKHMTVQGPIYIVQCSGFLISSDHQLYRVMPLNTPFGLVIPLLQSQSHVQLFLTLLRVYTITILHVRN
jgi:hypothetical protein